jgi:hypothetical protein
MMTDARYHTDQAGVAAGTNEPKPSMAFKRAVGVQTRAVRHSAEGFSCV